MKVKNLFIGLTTVLPLFAVTQSSANEAAKAQPLDTYIEENSRKKNRTVREGLNDKLDNAAYKLIEEAKYSDSIQKLSDFVYTVEQQAIPKKKKDELTYKIDPVKAGEIAAGANGAIDCISWL